MQPKNKWKNLGILLVVLCSFLVISIVPLVSCDGETSVNVKFQILTGSGTQDYFTGDYFWYNITVTNSGTVDINATFTVTVRNTTGGMLGQVETFKEYLKPNATATLYPNYTRLGREEVFIYFMDTVGTYTVELTCDTPMTFYRYYETGRYTVEHNVSHLDIDAMPSYQKLQNNRWNQYLQDSENYMNTVKQYVAQSKIQATKTENLALVSIFIAMLTLFTSYSSLTKAARERLGVYRYVFVVELCICAIALIIVALS